MLHSFLLDPGLGQLSPQQLRSALSNLIPPDATPAEKIATIENALKSPLGQSVRGAMARWIVDSIVPVEALVPEAYLQWRPPVRDSMMFVVAHLSPARLAPKLLEQLELPATTPPETRLLRLIAKVPGLQKLGQVIARNQHLRPVLRNALARLENSIRDVEPGAIREIIKKELGRRIDRFEVEIAPTILSEASVSAVVRFTWKDPTTGLRQRGVFKVMKPHIPEYFAEDMQYLAGLAQHFGDRHHTYGFPAHLIPDTFRKVRRLLQHEVNFSREQKTLLEAEVLYRSTSHIRVPGLIRELCTPRITALTEEKGIKVTNAAVRLPSKRRRQVAEQLVEGLVAVPLFASQPDAVFHGDPHAGNLLYDNRTSQLSILDWALRERLSREQRRHLALLFLMVSLRDPASVSREVLALTQFPITDSSRHANRVRRSVRDFLDELPVTKFPSGGDAMRLLERLAIQGIKFPGSLVMLSKVMFTLEGILADVAGPDTNMGYTLARHVAQHLITNRAAVRSPLRPRDWLTLQCSAMIYAGRVCVQWEQTVLDRLLPASRSTARPT